MTLTLQTADKACDAVQRHVAKEIPDLMTCLILHQTGQRSEALLYKQKKILKHPAGKKIMSALTPLLEENDHAASHFVGLAKARSKNPFAFLKREQTLACFFINIDYFDSAEDIYLHSYQLVWHALNIIQKHQDNKEDGFLDVIIPERSAVTLAQHNALADAFSGLVMELSGHKAFLKKLGRKRSEQALTPQKTNNILNHPYPMILEAAQIIYDDFVQHGIARYGALEQAFKLAKELSDTLDKTSILQWQDFCRAAQEMAWIGNEPTKVLGAAAHTSEDAHIRSIAYLLSEILNIQPAAPSDNLTYNSFIDQDINEKHHLKLCKEQFQALIPQIKLLHEKMLMVKEAFRQNCALLDGKPVGWSAYALLLAAEAYEKAHQQDDVQPFEEIEKTFDDALQDMSWRDIQQVNNIIIELKRSGKKVDAEVLLASLRQREGFEKFINTLEINLEEGLAYEAQKESAKPAQTGNIMNYIGESNVKKE